ncbi:hypothetical protein D3C85_1171320 [compost metagenome]
MPVASERALALSKSLHDNNIISFLLLNFLLNNSPNSSGLSSTPSTINFPFSVACKLKDNWSELLRSFLKLAANASRTFLLMPGSNLAKGVMTNLPNLSTPAFINGLLIFANFPISAPTASNRSKVWKNVAKPFASPAP